jgi:Asp-tRNA(Asn)/Glu-tRNA(Gln) amidotransferase A subunit family amidase
LGAAELARQIRARELSVVEVIDAHIERIEAVNPLINAIVTPMFEAAREAAAAADRRIATRGTDDLPPLFGVPVTVKDCWPVAGVRFTAGSWYHRHDVADRDAEVVRRLRDAGAIILGKTNCPDMVFGVETVNPVFGRTRNLHALSHSAGGSSGGEGAIIAASGSPLGIGSDIGGSIRVPAASNGCVAVKPTTGRVPAEDHVPESNETVREWNHAGVIARRVEDMAMALEVLSSTPTRPLRDYPLEGVRCVVYIRNGFVPVSRQVAEAVGLAAGELESLGMQVVRDDSLLLYRLTALWTALMSRYAIPTSAGSSEAATSSARSANSRWACTESRESHPNPSPQQTSSASPPRSHASQATTPSSASPNTTAAYSRRCAAASCFARSYSPSHPNRIELQADATDPLRGPPSTRPGCRPP